MKNSLPCDTSAPSFFITNILGTGNHTYTREQFGSQPTYLPPTPIECDLNNSDAQPLDDFTGTLQSYLACSSAFNEILSYFTQHLEGTGCPLRENDGCSSLGSSSCHNDRKSINSIAYSTPIIPTTRSTRSEMHSINHFSESLVASLRSTLQLVPEYFMNTATCCSLAPNSLTSADDKPSNQRRYCGKSHEFSRLTEQLLLHWASPDSTASKGSGFSIFNCDRSSLMSDFPSSPSLRTPNDERNKESFGLVNRTLVAEKDSKGTKICKNNSALDALIHMAASSIQQLDRKKCSTGKSVEPFDLDCLSQGAKIMKHRKTRTTFSNSQLSELEHNFNRQKYLTPADRDRIAKHLGLSNTQVITWFQNRRAKLKRESEELERDLLAARQQQQQKPTNDRKSSSLILSSFDSAQGWDCDQPQGMARSPRQNDQVERSTWRTDPRMESKTHRKSISTESHNPHFERPRRPLRLAGNLVETINEPAITGQLVVKPLWSPAEDLDCKVT